MADELLDKIADAIKKGECKAGFIVLELETGKDKTFTGIERLMVDLRGDNDGLAQKIFEETGADLDLLESEFLETAIKLFGDLDE